MKYAFDLKLQEYFASIERKLRSKPLILGGPSTAPEWGRFCWTSWWVCWLSYSKKS